MHCQKWIFVAAALACSGCAVKVESRSGNQISSNTYNSAIAQQGKSHYCGTNNCDTPPQLIQASAPVYPIAELHDRQSGFASVIFDIEETGLVANIRVKSATSDDFAQAAVQAVRTWRFKPAMLNGQPVKITAAEEFPFNLGTWK